MNDSVLASKLRKLISVVDNLRDIGLEQYISLPKVVVVGTQSSGKSSLLQQIVGLDFLPRGSGVVTRRPLEMRLSYVPHQSLPAPYATFEELPGKKFTNFNEVRQAIEDLTDRVCGKQKNIVDKPIILNVYSSSCPNLTLVDLPGLTKVPIAGQPENIYEITEKMTRKYIDDERTIILCVIAANQDLSTSEALSMVRKIDVAGERTLGCLTKIDIMDRGTNARHILLNEEIKLRLGYVGIKNRSQQDIIEKKPVSQSVKEEKVFFSTNPAYSSLPPDTTGTQALTNKLTNLLYTQIKKFMPSLIQQLTTRLHDLETRIKQYGPPLPNSDAAKVDLLWKMCNQFLTLFKNCLEGGYAANSPLDAQALTTGSRVHHILSELYEQVYYQAATRKITDKQIQQAIHQFEGETIPGFPSLDSFLYLMIPLIQQLKKPALEKLRQVHQVLDDIIVTCAEKALPKFDMLRADFIEAGLKVFKDMSREAHKMIDALFESEVGYIHTNDFTYLSEQVRIDPKEKLSPQAMRNPLIYILRKRIDMYSKIVVRNLRDMVPKQIFMFLMVQGAKNLQYTIFQLLAKHQKFDAWLALPADVKHERERVEKQYQTMKNAEKCIKMDPSLYEIYVSCKNKHYKFIEEENMRIKRQSQIISKQKDQSQPKTKPKQPPAASESKPQVPNSTSKQGMASLFGEDPSKIRTAQQPQQIGLGPLSLNKNPGTSQGGQQAPKPVEPNKSNNNQDIFANFFGKGTTVNKEKGLVDNYNDNMGKATDKAVDELYKNEQFKKESKNAVEKGTAAMVQQKLGPGNEAISGAIGKGAAALFGMDATQEYLKNKTKEAARDQTQIKR